MGSSQFMELRSVGYCYFNGGSGVHLYVIFSRSYPQRERERENVLTNYGDLGGWSVNC